jgi:hypothetical protein
VLLADLLDPLEVAVRRTMMPPSPWIGSTRKPAVFGVMAFSRASASPYGIEMKPGVNGPNPSRAWWLEEKLTIVVVRPWKFGRRR